MNDDTIKKALGSGWNVFLSSFHPDPRVDLKRFGAELERSLSDAFVEWAGARPELVGADEATMARRFASSLSLFAAKYDLLSRHAVGVTDDVVAGAWRLYLEREEEASAPGESAFGHLLDSLVRKGRIREANLLSRILFARWVDDSRIDEAIDELTSSVLAGPISVKMPLVRDTEGGGRHVRLNNAGAMRALLEDQLGSRITLSDIVDLMEIGSPLMPLEEILIEHSSAAGERPSLALHGTYTGPAGEESFTSYTIHLSLGLNGKPEISHRTIEIDPKYRRSGIAARSVLSLTLFAMRHGMENWADLATNLGVFTWHKLGAQFNPRHLRMAFALLEEIRDSGIAPDIRLDDIDPEDIDSIAGFWIWESALASKTALDNWLIEHGSVREPELEDIAERIPLGELALRSISIEVFYDTEQVLEHLIEGHFPSSMKKMDEGPKISADEGLALSGMEEALERAVAETEMARAIEKKPARTSKRLGGIIRSEANGKKTKAKTAQHIETKDNGSVLDSCSDKATAATNAATAGAVTPPARISR